MKKYQLQRIGESEIIGTFDWKADAANKLAEIIEENNEEYDDNEEGYLTPFDFTLKEVDVLDVNKEIGDYDAARKYLGIAVGSINVSEKHQKAMFALYKLITIAEAWNKADDFVPDYDNPNQWKWYPWFKKTPAGFVYETTSATATNTYAHFGSRLCFKSSDRARQFGKQFIELWNEVLLIK